MGDAIESVQREVRVFRPPASFSARARVKSLDDYGKLFRDAADNPESFWGDVAKEFHWFTPWSKVREWNPPNARWFIGGKTNISHNCLDRHVAGGRRNKAAIITELESGEVQTLTYDQLLREVCRLAHVLKSRGINAGDRVGIYMPNCAEAAIAMLACARIGAPHTVIFGGFSAQAIADRLNDCKAKAVITADGLRRRGRTVDLKNNVDQALTNVPSVEAVIVHRNTGDNTPMKAGRDLWWHEAVEGKPRFIETEAFDAEHPLFLLYTSGTTGKPKGILHTTGGYMVWAAYTARSVFDLREDDVYFCTADVGWITGHSYVVYGILANGATSLIYEGAPTWPDAGRLWSIVERHGVNIFYTAPTAIRTFMRLGDEWVKRHDRSSLRLLGSVGEPINPEAWMWYHRVVGDERCPIVDTWWQTETGGIMISPLPGGTPTKPGSATLPLPGVAADVVDEHNRPVPPGKGGRLVIREPWPGMLRGIYGDPERFKNTYFPSGGIYVTGDAAHRDADGYIWVLGRMDDVVNVSGHRLGTAEIESALVSHPSVAEAAVVARPDALTGQALVAFVTPRGNATAGEELRRELGKHVTREIGKLAVPADIRFTNALPKTRSGKIMRRLLRDIACGNASVGDTTTLEDYSVLQKLRESEE